MSGGKKTGDLVFNEDFDKEPTETPPVPPPPRPSPPPPAPPPVETPHVEEEAVVPAVPPAPTTSQGETSEVILDFTASTAAPVTTGDINPVDDDTEQPLNAAENAPPEKKSWFSLKPFQKYFDVDDKEVGVRLLHASTGPFKGSFNGETVENPDLWGPFWIATTLIFLTAVSSNLKSYVDHRNSDKKSDDWDGDYSIIGKASLMFYIYLFGAGLLLYFILRFAESTMALVHIWCIYGYSWTVMIPALTTMLFIYLIPNSGLSDAIAAVVILGASAFSGAFLIRNFSSAVNMARKFVLLIVVFVVHMLPGCLIVFYFHGT